MKLPAELGRAMQYRRQQDGASIFNNAFSTSYTYAGLNSKALCNSAHSAVSSSTTWSNTGTTALSIAAIKASRLAMRKYSSPSDNIIQIMPNLILVPIDKEDTIQEILKTQKVPYSTENTTNILNGAFQYIAWNFLSSTTAWFMMAIDLMKENLYWFNRINTEFNKDIDTDTLIRKWSSYMRYSQVPSDWRWIYGQNAAT